MDGSGSGSGGPDPANNYVAKIKEVVLHRGFSDFLKHKLLHRAEIPAKNPVNNSSFRLNEPFEFIG